MQIFAFSNHSLGRGVARTRISSLIVLHSRYKAQYSKRTKQWRPVAVLEGKNYTVPKIHGTFLGEKLSMHGIVP